jgi:hypothetical protein
MGNRCQGCGWRIRECCFVTVQGVDTRRRLEVARFKVAWPDHSACRKHVQHRPELSTPCTLFPHAMKRRHEHTHGTLNASTDGLHPQNAPKIFVDLPGTMTLGAAGKKLSHL